MLYAILAAIILIADQWVKYWTTLNIVLDTGEMPLFPGIVKLVNVHNSGAAFGFLSSSESARWVFIIIAIVFTLVLIVVMARRVFPSKFANFCCTLAIAGAIGNCIDRFIYGYVVDMFKAEFINFAVFNVADIFLVIACVLFIFYLLFGYNRKKEVETEKNPDTEKKSKKDKKDKKEKKSKKSKKADIDYDEDDSAEEEMFIHQIESSFAHENEPQPISEAAPEEDIDIRPEDIMFGIKGLDIEEPAAEPAPAIPEPEIIPEPEPEPDPFDFSLESILEEFR